MTRGHLTCVSAKLCRCLAVAVSVVVLSISPQLAADDAPSWESLPWDERIGSGWFESQAEAGDAEAQYRLGEIYEAGLGDVTPDLDEAIAWYGRAAEQGHARAAFRLGRLLERQSGQEESAVAAYRQASLAGLPEATYNLARLYRDGAGVRQDLRWAARLYRQAYGAGLTRAALDLAQLALVGPDRNEVRALAWALRARDDGLAEGARLAERLTALLNEAQREEAEQLGDSL